MKALVIPADRARPIAEIHYHSPEDIETLIGGYFESLPCPGRDDVLVLVCEEGEHMGLPYNLRATQLLRGIDTRFRDAIFGDLRGGRV